MNREEMVRLATIADAVVGNHTRTLPLKAWREPKHAHLLKSPEAFVEDIVVELSDNAMKGTALPWPMYQKALRLRSHELSVWAGSNGSAKSTVLSEIMLSLAIAGHSVVIVSLETTARRVAAKMVAQAFASRHLARDRIQMWATAMADTLCFLDFTGDLLPAEVIKLVRYCAHELGTEHILIDNLTKILSADNEHVEQQRLFIAQLHRTAIDTGMHIHVVAHTRKPSSEEDKPPGRYEIAGSRTLSDQPDNVVMVWRNRTKEQKIDRGQINAASEPDLILRVDKQRYGQYEGQMKLWMQRDCYRFKTDAIDCATPMVNF